MNRRSSRVVEVGARILGFGDGTGTSIHVPDVIREPGMAADVVAFDMRGLETAGALHDPVAALVFCAPQRVARSLIDGRVVVREGRLTTLDTRTLVARHNALAADLVRDEAR